MTGGKWYGRRWGLLVALWAGLWLCSGCASLCTKHLTLYRDTQTKGLPTSSQALLLTNPDLARAVAPGANLPAGLPWALKQPAYEADFYLLSLDAVDGQPVYQGLCLDTTTTDSLEVHPGSRRLAVRLELFGPWGQEKVKETVTLDLVPGRVYFLYPGSEGLGNRQLVLKVQYLDLAYDAGVRTRVQDWNRQHQPARTITD